MKRRKIKRIEHAEKIAAGEVVERPANIVKELIENSIDAGATEIRVIVKKAGKRLINIIDDGEGIPPDELEFAFERHTSNKIRRIEDLDSLSTLGFRGEALASIAAVTHVEITSRIERDTRGMKLIIHGGKLIEKKEESFPIGTNLQVKNLFYNLPARQKFLKKDYVELGHITDVIQRYALAYTDIHFIYIHNDLSVINCPATNDLKTTIFHIYGKKTAQLMELVNYNDDDDFKIHGLIGHPQISKKNRTHSSLFINKRYVISDLLFRAMQEAFKGIVMIGKHPFFVLHLELDPSIVDFNVHPKKLHVRFENDELVYNKFYNIIRAFVEDRFIIKEDKYSAMQIEDFIINDTQEVLSEKGSTKTRIERPIKEIREKKISSLKGQAEVESPKEMEIEKTIQLRLTEQDGVELTTKNKLPESYIREKYIIAKDFPRLRLISYTGQLSNNIYVVLEGINLNGESGLYILDQHAASERVKKEYFIKLHESSKKSKQMLISPLKIDVSPSETYFLRKNIKNIRSLGFNFDHFGGNTFILREIPTVMDKIPRTDIILEIISDMTSIGKDKSFEDVKEQIINYLACHKSIRGGDLLTLEEIRNLIIDLANCKDSFHCAHGRPTLKFISFKELDKLFKRTG